MALFVIVKRKGTKKWLGAIPARKGVGKVQLSKLARKQVRKGFQFKIINSSQLKRLIQLQGAKGFKVKKKSVKKKRRRRSAKKKP